MYRAKSKYSGLPIIVNTAFRAIALNWSKQKCNDIVGEAISCEKCLNPIGARKIR